MNFQKLSVFNNQTRKKLNRPTTSIEIESVIIIKKELLPILLKLFQKTEEEGTLPNSFNDITIIMKPEQDKGTLT